MCAPLHGLTSKCELEPAVPELNPQPGIKLNERVSLRRPPHSLSLPHRTVSPASEPIAAKPSGDHTPLGRFVRTMAVYQMISTSAPRGSKHRAQKPRSSPPSLAKRFLELHRLRKELCELEKPLENDRQQGAASARTDLRDARNDIEEPYQYSNVGAECESRVGSDMAPMEGDRPAEIYHGPPCLWRCLAASRWAPLDLQRGHRRVKPWLENSAYYQAGFFHFSIKQITATSGPQNEKAALRRPLIAQVINDAMRAGNWFGPYGGRP
jgi:hypothetical protein